jgi:hypothetical protein
MGSEMRLKRARERGGVARHVEFFGRGLAQVLKLRNKNSLLKKLLAVAHVENGGVAAGEQDDGRVFGNCCPLLPPPRSGGVRTVPLGVAFDAL